MSQTVFPGLADGENKAQKSCSQLELMKFYKPRGNLRNTGIMCRIASCFNFFFNTCSDACGWSARAEFPQVQLGMSPCRLVALYPHLPSLYPPAKVRLQAGKEGRKMIASEPESLSPFPLSPGYLVFYKQLHQHLQRRQHFAGH